ncbi:two-component sensor histidine kinase, partial [Pseudoroseomonas aestuarii]
MDEERPALHRWLGSAALIGGVPLALLALLAVTGRAEAGPALFAWFGAALAALLLALRWLGNLSRLAAVQRRADAGEGAWPEPPSAPALLPALAEVSEGVARLARSLAERGELLGRMRRADAAILESLPDPLLVLGADRAALRATAAACALFGARAAEATPP